MRFHPSRTFLFFSLHGSFYGPVNPFEHVCDDRERWRAPKYFDRTILCPLFAERNISASFTMDELKQIDKNLEKKVRENIGNVFFLCKN